LVLLSSSGRPLRKSRSSDSMHSRRGLLKNGYRSKSSSDVISGSDGSGSALYSLGLRSPQNHSKRHSDEELMERAICRCGAKSVVPQRWRNKSSQHNTDKGAAIHCRAFFVLKLLFGYCLTIIFPALQFMWLSLRQSYREERKENNAE